MLLIKPEIGDGLTGYPNLVKILYETPVMCIDESNIVNYLGEWEDVWSVYRAI